MTTLKMCLFPERERGLRPGWRSWAALGAYVSGLGPLLRPMLAVLGRSWGLYGRSRARKCEEHGYLENMLISRAGARSAAWGSVLSCSWSLCCWSWAALGAYVGGLGLLLGPKLAVLGRLGAGEVGLDAMWSVLGGDQGRNVAQTLAGKPFWRWHRFGAFLVPQPPYAFFYIYIYIYTRVDPCIPCTCFFGRSFR